MHIYIYIYIHTHTLYYIISHCTVLVGGLGVVSKRRKSLQKGACALSSYALTYVARANNSM